MSKENDEIDLMELFRQMLIGFYYYINRRSRLLIIFSIIGIFIGLGIHLANRTVYQSRLIASTESIKPEIIIDLVNSLDALNQSDKKQLQKILHLNDEDINNIKKIESDTVKTYYKLKAVDNKYIYEIDFTNIYINITYKNKLNLDTLENKIVNRLKNNKFISKELNNQKQSIQTLIAQLDKEIYKLDSLQNNILAASMKSSNISPGQLMILNENSNSFFHKDIMELSESRVKYINRLETLSPLQVIKPFDKSKTKEKTIIENVGFFFGIFFGLGFLVSIILEMKRKAIQLTKKD
ncbi:MAG: hypothetical protein JXR51_09650 [Bacteroidales bacterium]|nr:hypothetical protein [Bacteroidales bacterium]MBN2757429.1 hypothetical protein [Bacteroidales bacterium]